MTVIIDDDNGDDEIGDAEGALHVCTHVRSNWTRVCLPKTRVCYQTNARVCVCVCVFRVCIYVCVCVDVYAYACSTCTQLCVHVCTHVRSNWTRVCVP